MTVYAVDTPSFPLICQGEEDLQSPHPRRHLQKAAGLVSGWEIPRPVSISTGLCVRATVRDRREKRLMVQRWLWAIGERDATQSRYQRPRRHTDPETLRNKTPGQLQMKNKDKGGDANKTPMEINARPCPRMNSITCPHHAELEGGIEDARGRRKSVIVGQLADSTAGWPPWSARIPWAGRPQTEARRAPCCCCGG